MMQRPLPANSGVERLIDTGRHVYTNWQPIMTQRVFHERMNPWKWANREITYTNEMCSRTLDILAADLPRLAGCTIPDAIHAVAGKGSA